MLTVLTFRSNSVAGFQTLVLTRKVNPRFFTDLLLRRWSIRVNTFGPSVTATQARPVRKHGVVLRVILCLNGEYVHSTCLINVAKFVYSNFNVSVCKRLAFDYLCGEARVGGALSRDPWQFIARGLWLVARRSLPKWPLIAAFTCKMGNKVVPTVDQLLFLAIASRVL